MNDVRFDVSDESKTFEDGCTNGVWGTHPTLINSAGYWDTPVLTYT